MAMNEPLSMVHVGEEFIHVKTKGHYRILNLAVMQASNNPLDNQAVVIYAPIGKQGLYVRPTFEFCDGRFQRINRSESVVNSIQESYPNEWKGDDDHGAHHPV